jgi:imidazolonepropionase-like amidohydrolase
MMAPPPADERPSVRVHVKRLKSLCVEILTVTDPAILTAIPGFAMHDELAELVRLANMTPREALAAAAIRPARFLRVADLVGTVAPGKVADLLLLDIDPLVDIANTQGIHAVVANGRLLEMTGTAVPVRRRC